MDSQKVVTKYESKWKGTLEWEIQDVSLYMHKCSFCWDGTDHTTCSAGNTQTMDSAEMQLPAGEGKLSKWHFHFKGVNNPNGFSVGLYFDGFFGSASNESQMSGLFPLNFKYNAVVEASLLKNNKLKVETLQNADGLKTIDNLSTPVYSQFIGCAQLKSVWPDGNLRISADISELSGMVKEVDKSGPFLDLLDLKDDLPGKLFSCYGNLLNNPDLSDFKIRCEDSKFHAHKLILSVRSPVFRAMIESGLKESLQNELKIEDMTIKTVKLMLEFIYKGTLENFPFDMKERIELLDCAEKYELDGLKAFCMRKIF